MKKAIVKRRIPLFLLESGQTKWVWVGKRRFLVLDLDGTLFRWSLLLYLIDELVEMGVFKRSIYAEFEKERALWDGREKDGRYDDFINAAVRAFAKYIRGVKCLIVIKAAERVVEKHGHEVYTYTRELVEKAQRNGWAVIALSHSPRVVVEAFCARWGIEYWRGTNYFIDSYPEDRNRRYDGSWESPDKEMELKTEVTLHGLDFSYSIGVGDTLGDSSFLKLVENPIAFNPSSALMRHARRKGWLRVYERKDVRIKISRGKAREIGV